jgi:GNAT superfamily N-acetyltransferase
MSRGGRSPRSPRASSGSVRSSPRAEPLPSEPLAAQHVTAAFSSGNDELDEWLRSSALTADASGTGRTWVWTPDRTTVIAYYTLAPHVVRRDDVPKKVGRGSPGVIPAILLARLALAESLHGRGLGAALLADALARACEAIKIVGGRLIVVDAIDDYASHFYEHHGFARTPSNPDRLVIKAGDVEASRGKS